MYLHSVTKFKNHNKKKLNEMKNMILHVGYGTTGLQCLYMNQGPFVWNIQEDHAVRSGTELDEIGTNCMWTMWVFCTFLLPWLLTAHTCILSSHHGYHLYTINHHGDILMKTGSWRPDFVVSRGILEVRLVTEIAFTNTSNSIILTVYQTLSYNY